MKESKHLEINEAKWDKFANSLDGKGWRYEYLRKAQGAVISLLDLKEDISILDIGCGTGWALGQASKLNLGKGSFYGVDLSGKMIEKANENFKAEKNFHFIKSNAETIPLEDNLFNIIICTNSFHHYLNPDKVLKEINRLLKLEGKIYILDITADIWIMKIANKLMKLLEPSFVKFYSTKEFKGLIVDAGLKYIGCKMIRMHQKVHIGEK